MPKDVKEVLAKNANLVASVDERGKGTTVIAPSAPVVLSKLERERADLLTQMQRGTIAQRRKLQPRLDDIDEKIRNAAPVANEAPEIIEATVNKDDTLTRVTHDTPSTPPDQMGKLTQAEQDALERERADLVKKLPSLTQGAWGDAHHRLLAIEEKLRRARYNDHQSRKHQERAEERQPQHTGAGTGNSAARKIRAARLLTTESNVSYHEALKEVVAQMTQAERVGLIKELRADPQVHNELIGLQFVSVKGTMGGKK